MKKIMLLMVLGIFLISLANAALIGPFQEGNDIELIQTCDDCTYNNITTIVFPNGTHLVLNAEMDQDGTYFNWTLNSSYTQTSGVYIVNGVGDLEGSDTVWAYDFDITPSGRAVETSSSIISFLGVLLFLIIGGLLFLFSLKDKIKTPIKWTLWLGSFIFFLAGLNLVSVILPDALLNDNVVSFFDSFTAISFIMFYFSAGLIGIIWILAFFQTWIYRKNMRAFKKFGGEYGK
jgi:hypothetical protein